MARYRALRKGQSHDGVWHQAGDEFASVGPRGSWIELISDPELAPEPATCEPKRKTNPVRSTSPAAE